MYFVEVSTPAPPALHSPRPLMLFKVTSDTHSYYDKFFFHSDWLYSHIGPKLQRTVNIVTIAKTTTL